MRKRILTTTQLECLRKLDPEDTVYWDPEEDKRELPKNTMRALERRGYASSSPKEGWVITPTGARLARHHVRNTGNGPEDMKALLRF